MSRSINSDKSWGSTDEEYFDEFNDNNSFSTNSSKDQRRISSDEVPGGVVTTHSVSAVIRPESKLPRTDPLQFVKISNNELSKKVRKIKMTIKSFHNVFNLHSKKCSTKMSCMIENLPFQKYPCGIKQYYSFDSNTRWDCKKWQEYYHQFNIRM